MPSDTAFVVDGAHPGPVQSLYGKAKEHLPGIIDNKMTSIVDKQIVRALGKVDRMILNASDSLKKAGQDMPDTQNIKQYVAATSDKTITQIQNFLEKAIQLLGGSFEVSSAEPKDTARRLVGILSRTLQVNSLLAKNAKIQLTHFAQEPQDLIVNTKNWTNKLYIEVSAIRVALKELFVETLKQLFGVLGVSYSQTKNKIKLVLTKMPQRQEAYLMIKERLVQGKHLAIRMVKEGIEIVIDQEHYSSNIKKLMSSIVEVAQEIKIKSGQVVATSISSAQALYKEAIRNYKVQKALLIKSPSCDRSQ